MRTVIRYGLILTVILFICSGCTEKSIEHPNELNNSEPFTYSATETEIAVHETEPVPAAELIETVPYLTDIEPGAYQLRFESETCDEYMDYYLFIPNNAMDNMPIVVFLHGAVEIGHVELLENYGIVSVVDRLYGADFPFLLLLPCTHKPSWTDNSVPETLIEMIDEIAESYHADKGRICITGHSLGSVGTWKMVSLYSDYFSAAGPISCGIDEPLDFENCAKVPIIAYAGTEGADERNYNPAMHKLVDTINAAGGDAQMRVIHGADHEDMVTAAYTTELFDWMLSQ